MSKNVLLISDEILKDRTSIHGNIDPKLLYPEIKAAQDMYIHPILGTALYDKIINDVDGGTITGDYKDLLDDYIIDCLLYFVLAGLPEALSYQFWNKGVIRKVGDNTELPSMSELIDIANKYRIRAEWYAERLNKYLKQHSTTNFLPEYLQPGNGLDTINPEVNSYTMPIWLGDSSCSGLPKSDYRDKNNCHCNE
jgi:hypothetical protein